MSAPMQDNVPERLRQLGVDDKPAPPSPDGRGGRDAPERIRVAALNGAPYPGIRTTFQILVMLLLSSLVGCGSVEPSPAPHPSRVEPTSGRVPSRIEPLAKASSTSTAGKQPDRAPAPSAPESRGRKVGSGEAEASHSAAAPAPTASAHEHEDADSAHVVTQPLWPECDDTRDSKFCLWHRFRYVLRRSDKTLTTTVVSDGCVPDAEWPSPSALSKRVIPLLASAQRSTTSERHCADGTVNCRVDVDISWRGNHFTVALKHDGGSVSQADSFALFSFPGFEGCR